MGKVKYEEGNEEEIHIDEVRVSFWGRVYGRLHTSKVIQALSVAIART